MDVVSGPPAVIEVAQAALDEVEERYERGRYLDAWEVARAIGPLEAWRGAEARLLAGRLAAQLGAQRRGHLFHLAAFREHPESVDAWLWAVRAIHSRRGPYAGRAMVRRGHAGAGGSWEALALHAQLSSALRDFEDAEAHVTAALALSPEEPWLQVVRSGVLEDADQYPEALDAADRALALRPWYRPAVDARAGLLVLLGREEEAMALLADALVRLQAASTAVELLHLQMEHARFADAEETIARIDALTPLRSRALDEWLEGRRSDAAYHRGDVARAIAHARRARMPFYEKLAERLEAGGAAGGAVLPVPWVRQHHMTCAPATLSALARHFGAEAPHLEIAEAICYDGTPDHAERAWADREGFAARELTVTWDAARALVDRGVPFALSTVQPGSAHMQAVVGYDLARGTLVLRDPYLRTAGELVGEAGLAAYRATGPRGFVLLPPAEVHRLDGLELPEAELHAAYHRVQASLVAHDRAAAVQALSALEALAPGHRLALQGARSLAAYDGDEPSRLRVTEALLALAPDDVNLRLAKNASLADLGRRDARIAWLREERTRAGDPLLDLALAEVLREDARALGEALALVHRVLSRMPLHAPAYQCLGHVRWGAGDREEALVAYRTAACLDRTEERFAESYFRAARALGRADEAITFLAARFERFGRKAAWPAFTLHDALDALERTEEALAVLDRAVAWRPADGPLLLFAARKRAAAGDPEGAEALLARAGEAARPADVKRTAAQLAEARGELAPAAALWEAVAAMEPFDLEAVRATARLLQATRDGAAAVAFLRRAVERHPHHHGLARVHAEWLADAPAEEREPAIRRILEANPADAWAWRELALVLSWAHRAEEARVAVARAAEIEPAAPALHTVRAIALANTGEVAAAKDALREAIRLSVDEDWAVRELLRLSADAEERRRHLEFLHDEILRQVNTGDGLLAYQRAAAGVLEPGALLEELRAAHAARPDLWHAWVALGRQLAQAGHDADAVGLLRQAAERFALLPRIWLELGLAHRADGDRAAQREALERAVELAPAWPEAVMKLAELLHSEREFVAERALLSRATARAPTDAVLRGWLADACWAGGDREAAVDALEHALRLDPSYAWAWTTLVRFCGELGRPDAPRAVAERSAAERPHDAAAWVLAGRARDALDGKLEALDRALALAPRYATAHELRVEALADAGRLDEALAAARPEAYGGSPPRTLRLAGARLQVARGEPGVARLELEALLAAEPDYADGWAQLTEWHAEAGRHVDAAAAAQRLVRLSPDDPVAHGYLGRALLDGGEDERGRAELRRALELEPAYPWAIVQLLEAELQAGDAAAAAALLPLVEAHVPEEAGLRRAQIAARGGDAGAALEAFDGLARGDDRALLDRAAASLGDAGLSAALDARLDALLAAPETGRAAGALWVARSSRRGRLTRAGRRRLGRLLADARPTAAALGAAEAHVEQLALPRRALALRRFLARHGAQLAGDVSAWGTAGYALSSAKRHRRAAEWLAGWRERDGVRPWMLVNLAVSLRDLGREAAAREASAGALQLTRDHSSPMHEVLLACDAALDGDPGPAARLGREHEGLTGYYRFLLEMARAIAATGGADRRAAFVVARRHLRAAAAAKPDLSTEPHLRRVRRRAIARVARARAGGGALAPFWYLVARASAPRRA